MLFKDNFPTTGKGHLFVGTIYSVFIGKTHKYTLPYRLQTEYGHAIYTHIDISYMTETKFTIGFASILSHSLSYETISLTTLLNLYKVQLHMFKDLCLSLNILYTFATELSSEVFQFCTYDILYCSHSVYKMHTSHHHSIPTADTECIQINLPAFTANKLNCIHVIVIAFIENINFRLQMITKFRKDLNCSHVTTSVLMYGSQEAFFRNNCTKYNGTDLKLALDCF